MRTLPAIAIVAYAAALAADPVRFQGLALATRDKRPEARLAATRVLVETIGHAGEGRIAAKIAVITDDPAVRAPIVDALIALGDLDPASAARVPSLAALGQWLHILLHDTPIAATECHVAASTTRDVTLECRHEQCRSVCLHDVTTATLSVATRWTVVAQSHTARDDGTCGDCDFVE